MRIRKFQKSDAETLAKILQLNKQYTYPEVEGPEAMQRVSECPSALFLVAEENVAPLVLSRQFMMAHVP